MHLQKFTAHMFIAKIKENLFLIEEFEILGSFLKFIGIDENLPIFHLLMKIVSI